MKKLAAFLCVTMLLFNCVGSCLAEESLNDSVQLMDQINQDVTISEEATSSDEDADDIDNKMVEKTADGTRAADDQRSVFINGNSFTVEIMSSLNLFYQKPSDPNIVCFTQDYLQQADLFNRFYSSPISAAFGFIENNIFFNIYDASDGLDIYVYVEPTSFSASYPNMSNLSESTVASLLNQNRTDAFPTAIDAQYGWLGGNVYLFFNCLNNGVVELFTTVNGYQVEVLYKVKSQNDVNKGLTLLENMTITSK